MELTIQKVIFVFLCCLVNKVTAQFECQLTSGENSQFTYSKSCSEGNVLLINWAYYSKSPNQQNCGESGACYSRDVSDELKLAYSISMSFTRVLYVPRIDGSCSGNYVSLGVSTNCIANAKIYDLASTFNDGSAYGNFFIFARYNLYSSSNNIPAFNKATLTIPAGCEFITRILEMYAMTTKANVCAYQLVVESPPGNRIKSPCMGSTFTGDYHSLTTSQVTEVSFYLERQYPVDESLIDLKIWVMIEIRQNGNYVRGVGMKSDSLIAPTSTTTTTTTTPTTLTTTTTTTSPTTRTIKTSPTITTTTSTTTTTTSPTTSTTTSTTSTTTSPTTSTATSTTTTSPTTTTSATLKPPSSSTTTTNNIPQNNSSSTTTTQPIPFKGDSGLSTEAKVGLGIGLSILCLLVLFTIVGLIVLCLHRKRHIIEGKPKAINTHGGAYGIEEGNHTIPLDEPTTPPPPPPLTYADLDKYKPIRRKGPQNMSLPGLMETFTQDPTSIYYPLGDVYSTVSKSGSVKDWQPPPEEDRSSGTVGNVNSYPSNTWELTHYSPPSVEVEGGDYDWGQEGTVDQPKNYEPGQPGRNRFQKNQHTNSVIESHSKQKVKKAKHVTISHDPPSYMESQMDRPHNFMGGPNFMF